jgi:hypothetical protein
MARIGVDLQLSVEETEALLAAIEEALGTKLTGQQILRLKEVLIRQRFQTEDFTPARVWIATRPVAGSRRSLPQAWRE